MSEESRKRILLRRAKFVAAAFAASTAAGQACGGTTQVCLKISVDAGDAGDAGDASDDADAQPQVCLAPIPPDASDSGDGSG